MQSSQTPKNFFIQMGIFFSLYVSAISFLVFLFSVIDSVFPPALNYYSDSSSGIRFSISTLIIVFPLFIWLGRVYRKFVETNAELKESKLRKWVIYFTLFMTGATIAIDAIVLVNTFLGGEDFATGFVLKVLSVFAVAGAIFTFCLKDLNGYFDGNPKQSKFWSIVVSIVVLLSVVGGFVLIGSPSTQRSKAYDNQRITDLQSIQWQVTNYYQQKGKLPESLNDLKDPLSGQVIPVDPTTKKDYWYYIANAKNLNFDICATFETDNTKDTKIENYDHELWTHEATQVCYNRTIDPDKYPLISSKIKN